MILKLTGYLVRLLDRWHRSQTLKKLQTRGTHTTIPASVMLFGQHMQLGNDVHLGENNVFMCVNAPIILGDHTMLGPGVTMITGDHRMDVVGKYMSEVGESDKLPENDLPIILEGDNWVGANVTILKGVTVGEGAVIAAGALVTGDVPPYAIAAGVPAKVIKYRFDDETLAQHKELLEKRANAYDTQSDKGENQESGC